MHRNRSIQKSWDKLESFFKVQDSPSSRSKSSKSRPFFQKSLSRTPSKFRKNSMPGFTILGVSQSQLEQLYTSKCADLQIPAQNEQRTKFFIFCCTHFVSKTLRLTQYSIGPQAGKILGEILSNNPYFSYIKLGKNNLGDEGMKYVLKGITKNSAVVNLDLGNNNISAEGASLLLKTLSEHETLYSLSLASKEALHKNRLTKMPGKHIQEFLQRNSVLGVLNLYGTGINECVNEISKGLEYNKNLISLNLGGNFLTPVEIKALVPGMLLSSLIILDLSNNLISNEGCEFIANLVNAENKIEQLYLNGNNIGSKGSKLIFAALYSNNSLRKFDISDNLLCNLPSDILYALESNVTLKELCFAECGLRKDALAMLAKVVMKNKGIEILNIAGNSIEDSYIQPICNAFSRNFILKSLNLSKNRIRNSGAIQIAEALQLNHSLTEVNLNNNNIKDAGAEELCETTRINNILQRLTLENNTISAKYLETISKNLKKNIEANKKQIPSRVKQQLTSISFNKNSLKEINKRFLQSQREKEDLIIRISKHSEKLNETKSAEVKKYDELHKSYLLLKEKNLELNNEFESMDKETFKIKGNFRIESKRYEKGIEQLDVKIRRELRRRDELKAIQAGRKEYESIEIAKIALEAELAKRSSAENELQSAKILLHESKKALAVIQASPSTRESKKTLIIK